MSDQLRLDLTSRTAGKAPQGARHAKERAAREAGLTPGPEDLAAERLVTASELGEQLALSTATILDRFERGELPGFRLFGKKGGPVRFRVVEVLAVLETWRFGPTPP